MGCWVQREHDIRGQNRDKGHGSRTTVGAVSYCFTKEAVINGNLCIGCPFSTDLNL